MPPRSSRYLPLSAPPPPPPRLLPAQSESELAESLDLSTHYCATAVTGPSLPFGAPPFLRRLLHASAQCGTVGFTSHRNEAAPFTTPAVPEVRLAGHWQRISVRSRSYGSSPFQSGCAGSPAIPVERAHHTSSTASIPPVSILVPPFTFTPSQILAVTPTSWHDVASSFEQNLAGEGRSVAGKTTSVSQTVNYPIQANVSNRRLGAMLAWLAGLGSQPRPHFVQRRLYRRWRTVLARVVYVSDNWANGGSFDDPVLLNKGPSSESNSLRRTRCMAPEAMSGLITVLTIPESR